MTGTSTDARHTGDARHAARSGLVQVLTILLQAVTTGTQVIFARLFGPTVYGMYQVMVAVVELATRGAPGGADKGMLRYVAAARAAGNVEGVRRALGTGMRLCLFVSLGISVGLFLGADAIGRALDLPSVAPALKIVAWIPPFAGIMITVVQATLAARVTRVNLLVRGLIEPTFLLCAGVTAWALGGRLRSLALAHATSAVLTAGVALWLLRGVFQPAELRHVLRAPRVRGFSAFSLTMAASELMNVAYQRADLLILTAYLGAEGAAVYGATEFITRVVANIRYAFDAIVAGVMAEAVELGDFERLRRNLQLTTRWVVTVAALLVGGVVVLRRELLTGLYGSAYAAGSGAIVILAAAHFFNASVGLTMWILVAGGRSRLALINNVLGALLNVGASLFFVPRYGLVGAALASLCTIVFVQSAALVEAHVLYKVSPFSRALWKPLLAAACAMIVETIAHRSIASPSLRLVVVLASGLVVYLGALVTFGLPEEERHLALRLWRRARAALGRSAPAGD